MTTDMPAERTHEAEHARPERGRRNWIAAWSAAIVTLLLVPLLTMQFTDEVNWDVFDFVLLGVLLAAVGIVYRLAMQTRRSTVYRSAVAVALASVVFLVVANGAVGIIGSEDNDANMLYYGVIGVGLIGALIARFRPRGLSLTMFAIACTQALIAVVAVIAGWGGAASGPLEVIGLNVVFVALFVGSALLFRAAARGEAATGAL